MIIAPLAGHLSSCRQPHREYLALCEGRAVDPLPAGADLGVGKIASRAMLFTRDNATAHLLLDQPAHPRRADHTMESCLHAPADPERIKRLQGCSAATRTAISRAPADTEPQHHPASGAGPPCRARLNVHREIGLARCSGRRSHASHCRAGKTPRRRRLRRDGSRGVPPTPQGRRCGAQADPTRSKRSGRRVDPCHVEARIGNREAQVLRPSRRLHRRIQVLTPADEDSTR